MADRSPEQPIEVDAVVRGFSFRSPDSDFAVARVELPGKTKLETAVGPLKAVAIGETLRLQGRWVDDSRFGRQLKVDGWLPATPETIEGLERYLSSGVVDGIGPELAHRLVKAFGLDTFAILDHQPERLTEVEGIGPVRAKKIVAAWADQRDARALLVLLRGHGLGMALAGRISRHFGARALEVCRQDPYRLALEVPGVGFTTADRLAQAQGLPPDHPTRLAAGAQHFLAEAAEQGHVALTLERLTVKTADRLAASAEAVASAMGDLEREDRLVIDRSLTLALAYLPKLYRAETQAARALRDRLQRKPPSLDVRLRDILDRYEAKANISLAEGQRAALHAARSEGLLVVTGGPGTGKTTLVRALLALYAAGELKVRLAAPTGRAAKRLEETTGSPASTLHRLLEVDPRTGQFQRDGSAPVEADVVVVDEVSMVDLPLLASLLGALEPTTRLVLVGDADQLPSVGPGRVLADLLEAGVPAVRLTDVFRQAQASKIVQNAYRVLRGEAPERSPPDPSALSDFYIFERSQPEAVKGTVLELIQNRIPRGFGLDPTIDIQVLTPMNRGPLGAQTLNEALQARLNPGSGGLKRGGQVFRVGDKVMQTRNDYDLGVLNGELGRVTAVDERAGKLAVDFDDAVIRYEPKALEHLSLAYACTVHKAQGSEYAAVIIVLARQHAIMLDRQLLYTAMTRARQLLIIVAEPAAIDLAGRSPREGDRVSGLLERLRASGAAKPPVEGDLPQGGR